MFANALSLELAELGIRSTCRIIDGGATHLITVCVNCRLIWVSITDADVEVRMSGDDEYNYRLDEPDSVDLIIGMVTALYRSALDDHR